MRCDVAKLLEQLKTWANEFQENPQLNELLLLQVLDQYQVRAR